MKIIDIMKDSAMLLGLDDDCEMMETMTEDNYVEIMAENKSVASLFNLIKYSIRELCTNYVPVATSVIIKTIDKKYPLSSLINFIRVQNVYQNSQLVKFKVVNRNLIFEEDGEYVINYLTYPEIFTVFDEIDFLENFSPDVIVLGLCSYYSLAHGMFEEFEDLHERYVAKAESLKNLKIFALPCRRWE
ncbi:MAG: hypothetical protein IJ415_01120 [Clostridia bacterium]|nr:hypothetical protein [Clostridia bacterium]